MPRKWLVPATWLLFLGVLWYSSLVGWWYVLLNAVIFFVFFEVGKRSR